jgi:hypothetical protein
MWVLRAYQADKESFGWLSRFGALGLRAALPAKAYRRLYELGAARRGLNVWGATALGALVDFGATVGELL